MKLLFNDVETTGVYHNVQDVIQTGGIISENFKPMAEFNLKCKPVNWKAIDPTALKVNHTTIQMLKSDVFEDPKETWKKLYKLIEKYFNGKKYVFAGQNAHFDRRFMNSWWDKHKTSEAPEFESYLEEGNLDLRTISAAFKNQGMIQLNGAPVPNVKLGTIIEALQIKVSGNLHDALTDIKATANGIYILLKRVKKIKESNPKHPLVKKFDKWLVLFN